MRTLKKLSNIFNPKIKSKKKIYCSPKNRNNTYSCFTRNSLIKIAKSWNKSYRRNKIKIKSLKRKKTKNIWEEINKKLKSIHKKEKYNMNQGEWCWIQNEFIKKLNDKEINNTFRPKTPKDWYKNKNEWLSTIDIENVMKQYENQYSNFKFIGPVPIDFDYEYSVGNCIVDELCKINIDKYLKKKIKNIGIIFNLDKHDQSGSHWVAMYIDLLKNKVYYFDSYGEKPPNEIDILAKRLKEQGLRNNNNIDYEINNVRFQYKNSECGVYCMYFITSLLGGQSFEEFKQNIIKDDLMNQKRGFFYSPNCSI